MTCLTFILAWFAVSALVWGGFGFANYRAAARREEFESCESCSLCGDPAFCFLGNINAFVCEKCFDAMNSTPVISHSVCLSCRDPIPIDDQPYCHECYARLEREGFFEE